MSESWKSVGDQFSALGERFSEHYHRLEEDRPEGTEGEKRKLDELMDQLNTVFSAVGNAVRDPDVQAEAKSAGTSILAAIGESFKELGDAIQQQVEAADAPPTAEAEELKASDSVDDAKDVLDRIHDKLEAPDSTEDEGV